MKLKEFILFLVLGVLVVGGGGVSGADKLEGETSEHRPFFSSSGVLWRRELSVGILSF